MVDQIRLSDQNNELISTISEVFNHPQDLIRALDVVNSFTMLVLLNTTIKKENFHQCPTQEPTKNNHKLERHNILLLS